MLWLLQKLRLLRAVMLAQDSPRQMAAGLACGILLGLLPKGNLLAILVASVLLSTRINLAIGLLAALGVSLVAPWCDPLTDRLGYWVLTFPPLTSSWQRLAQFPLAAWTSFNNTVVMGSFLLGTLLLYPTYRWSLPWMIRYKRWRVEREGAGWKRAESDPPEASCPPATAAWPLSRISPRPEPSQLVARHTPSPTRANVVQPCCRPEVSHVAATRDDHAPDPIHPRRSCA